MVLVLIVISLNLSKVMAKEANSNENKFQTRQTAGEDLQQLKEQIKEKFATIGATFRLMRSGRIAVNSGELTKIDGSTLTVVKDDKTYTVFTDDQTQLRRKFWGKSSLSEFSVGDKLNIVGTWKDEAKTQIQARFIKNISIQKRYGVFIGTVSNKTDTGFTFTTVARGVQQVTVTNSVEYTNRKGETINYSDIVNGHRIKVRGLWDSTNSTITEVTKVKDFDLPIRSSPASSPKAE